MNFKKWAELAVQKCISFGNGLDQPSSLQDSFIITGSMSNSSIHIIGDSNTGGPLDADFKFKYVDRPIR